MAARLTSGASTSAAMAITPTTAVICAGVSQASRHGCQPRSFLPTVPPTGLMLSRLALIIEPDLVDEISCGLLAVGDFRQRQGIGLQGPVAGDGCIDADSWTHRILEVQVGVELLGLLA